jgi:hypothetical protein
LSATEARDKRAAIQCKDSHQARRENGGILDCLRSRRSRRNHSRQGFSARLVVRHRQLGRFAPPRYRHVRKLRRGAFAHARKTLVFARIRGGASVLVLSNLVGAISNGIPSQASPTNVAFGGDDHRHLYITTRGAEPDMRTRGCC